MKSNKLKPYDKILYEYIEPEELSSIIGTVRRERQDKKDDIMLSQYCYNQIQTYLSSPTKQKEKDLTKNSKNLNNICVKPTAESLDSENKFWAERKDTHKHIKVDLVNSTGHSCLCNCTPVKQDNISIISEVHTDNANNTINNTTNTEVTSGNNKVDKNKSLGYSNIMVVSSHRDAVNGNADGTDANTEKLKTVRLKIKRFLDTILSNVDTFKSPEDDIEKIQLKQKAVEFCGRFSRNHLYEIGRALNETTKALNYCLPYNQWKHITSQSKSILNVHQVLLQAFSMFQRHMRIVWGYGDTHEKLHTLLQLTLEVNRICFPQQDKVDPTFTDLQIGCNKLIENLNNIFGDDAKSCASKSTLYYKEITPGLISRKMMAASSRMSNDVNYSRKPNMNWSGANLAAGDRFSMYRQQLPRRIAQNRKYSADIRNQRRTNNTLPRKSKSAQGFVKNPAENNARTIHQKESKSCPQICPSSLSGLFRKTQDIKNKNKIPTRNMKGVSRMKKCSDGHMEVIYPNTHLEALDECSNVSCDQLSNHNIVGSSESRETIDSKPCEPTTSKLSERRDAIEDAAVAGGCRYSKTTPAGDGEGRQLLEKNRDHSTISRSASNNVLLLVVKYDDSEEDEKRKIKGEPSGGNVGKVESNTNVKLTDASDIIKEKQNLKDNLIASFSKNILNTIKSPIPTHMKESNDVSKNKENKTILLKKDEPLKIPVTCKKKSAKENGLKKKLNTNCMSMEAVEAIHDYRMNFVKSLMDNPLYVHQNIKRPWEAVARISEKLIDDAIRTVAEEMEALLKQMVDVELKDFATISKT